MNALKNIPVITECNDLGGVKVLLRVDFNVTLDDEGNIIDDFRIQKARPTIDYLRTRGARVILVSHMKHKKEAHSLAGVSDYFAEVVPHTFIPHYPSPEADEIIEKMIDGDVVLLENVRMNEGEEKNDALFAEKLAGMADIFVNDAFAVAHRKHASVVGVPRFLPSYMGLLMTHEVENISRAFHPDHPFVFVLGGAKFETKVPLIEKFLKRADTVVIGGALANDILRAQGHEVGASLVSDGNLDIKSLLEYENLLVPRDVVVFDEHNERRIKDVEDVEPDDRIWDIGPKSLTDVERALDSAQFILWNGPFGNYEAGYSQGTFAIAKAIAQSKAQSVVGGGDTLAAIVELDLLDRYTFVSTGGGAMLEYLAHEDLPALKALRTSSF